MFPVRPLHLLACGVFIALAAGCGHDSARVLAPSRASRGSTANPARIGRAPDVAGGVPCDTTYQGPVLTLSGPGFEYHYPTGGYCPCPSAEVAVEVQQNQTVTFHWSADASGSCTNVQWYRWTLDIADVFDQTPRTNEATDLSHWSAPSLGTSATVGPFSIGPVHRFYVDAMDGIGFRSLGILRITVVTTLNRPPDVHLATAELAAPGPPNGGFSPVRILGVTDPDSDTVTITVTGVTQDEPVVGRGERATCPDAMLASGVASVRRERLGSGNGRVYTLEFTATDGRGGVSQGTADVCIAHGGGPNGSCVRDPLIVNSLAPCDTTGAVRP
jgi:hypothetical protein